MLNDLNDLHRGIIKGAEQKQHKPLDDKDNDVSLVRRNKAVGKELKQFVVSTFS
jgi:hypothetical protein